MGKVRILPGIDLFENFWQICNDRTNFLELFRPIFEICGSEWTKNRKSYNLHNRFLEFFRKMESIFPNFCQQINDVYEIVAINGQILRNSSQESPPPECSALDIHLFHFHRLRDDVLLLRVLEVDAFFEAGKERLQLDFSIAVLDVEERDVLRR